MDSYSEKIEQHKDRIKFIEDLYGISFKEFNSLTPLHYLHAMEKYAKEEVIKINS